MNKRQRKSLMENLEKLYKKDIEKAKQFKVNDVVRLSRRGLEFFNKKAIYNRRFGIVLSKIEDKPWCLKIQWEGLKNPEILSVAYLEKEDKISFELALKTIYKNT